MHGKSDTHRMRDFGDRGKKNFAYIKLYRDPGAVFVSGGRSARRARSCSEGGYSDFDLNPMGVATIAVTEKEDTYLARNTTMQLFVRVDREPDSFNMLATASTMAVIAVFDALAIEMAEEKNFTKEHFLRIHPGGEVGERLKSQLNE